MALWYLKQSSVTPRIQAIWLFHNKKIVRVLEYCDDVQWCVTNKESQREREQLACASDPPYVVTFLFISRFSCVVDEDCQVWLTLKCLATLCWYRVSYQDTPKTVVVKRQIEELQRTVESLRQSRKFLPRNMIKKNSHNFHVHCISVMRVVFVGFFPFNFLLQF